MDGISWTDLDSDEQRVIAMVAEGISAELCDPVALLTLRRIGFIKGLPIDAGSRTNSFSRSSTRVCGIGCATIRLRRH
jgi:hypothetical protein